MQLVGYGILLALRVGEVNLTRLVSRLGQLVMEWSFL